jgi:hypothetical protein
MYGPAEGAWVLETFDPIQIHPSGITVQSENARRSITPARTPAARRCLRPSSSDPFTHLIVRRPR